LGWHSYWFSCPWRVAAKPTPQPEVNTFVDVTKFGAKGDGLTDDTGSIQLAIAAAPIGSVLFFPKGNYLVTDELLIAKRISVTGAGQGSQIYQQALTKSLFHFQSTNATTGPHGLSVKDLYLGSAATAVGASLLKLTNIHHMQVDNVIMLGGYYGVHLRGSLLNSFVDLKSGVNFQGFFATTSTNQCWVFAERFNSFSANANAFRSPVLEGGVNGFRIEDMNSEGSFYIFGGTIEGVSGTGLYATGTFQPSIVSGLHFEANGVSDVVTDGARTIRFESILATNKFDITGDSRDIMISGGLIQQVNVGPSAKRTRLEHISHSFANCSGGIVDSAAPGETIVIAAANVCGGQ